MDHLRKVGEEGCRIGIHIQVELHLRSIRIDTSIEGSCQVLHLFWIRVGEFRICLHGKWSEEVGKLCAKHGRVGGTCVGAESFENVISVDSAACCVAVLLLLSTDLMHHHCAQGRNKREKGDCDLGKLHVCCCESLFCECLFLDNISLSERRSIHVWNSHFFEWRFQARS